MEVIGPAGFGAWWREVLALIAAALSVGCAVATGGLLLPCLLLSYLATAVLLPDALSLRSRLSAVEASQREASLRSGADERRFLWLADLTIDAVICTDTAERITYWNPAAEKLLGCSGEEALGSPIWRFLPDLSLPGGDTGSAPPGPPMTAPASLSVEGVTGVRKDGSKVELDLAVCLWDGVGGNRFTVVARPATAREHPRAGLARLEELEAAMHTVRRAAHDLGNLLSPLMIYAEMMEMELPQDHPALGYCRTIAASARRMEEISRELRALGLKHPMEQTD